MNLFAFLAKTELFEGIAEAEVEAVLRCLGFETREYEKGETVLRVGDRVKHLGLVVRGGVNIERVDVWGNRNILDRAGAGRVFAETYACVRTEPLRVDVVAAEQSEILFLAADKLTGGCPSGCAYHVRLSGNLLGLLARKNLFLSGKMELITPKSIRARLLAYFSAQAVRSGGHSFDIPFNRQELADFLAVDRSALSNELSKMRRDGLILCKKNHVRLKVGQED